MERVIPLVGGLNFRDLGGYETSDGQRVRWRRLFRAGAMSNLTAADEARVQGLGIRVLCDFRTRDERQRDLVTWAGSDIVRMEWDYDSRHISVRREQTADGFSAETARSAMLDFYRMLPTRFEQQYAALFSKLAAGSVPLVFGCSAGKDRTGMAAALVLSSLGVQREQIMADFTLTDRVVDFERILFQNPTRSLGLDEDRRFLLRLSPQDRAPLLRAAPEYLEAAFDQLRHDHGSVETYLQKRLNVTEAALQSIRAHLLEDGASGRGDRHRQVR
jgi:protein-tyrosine phosphatase